MKYFILVCNILTYSWEPITTEDGKVKTFETEMQAVDFARDQFSSKENPWCDMVRTGWQVYPMEENAKSISFAEWPHKFTLKENIRRIPQELLSFPKSFPPIEKQGAL